MDDLGGERAFHVRMQRYLHPKRRAKPYFEENNEFGFSYSELMMTRAEEWNTDQGAEVVPWKKAWIAILEKDQD